MKNQKSLIVVFMVTGLFILAASGMMHLANAAKPSANLNSFASIVPTSATAEPDSSDITSYSHDFNMSGKTYTVNIVTNSIVSNLTISNSGLGIQFETSVPLETTGFINVTVPKIVFGTKIAVFQDGVKLAENVSYTLTQNATDYLFHLEYPGGTHTIVVERVFSMPIIPTIIPTIPTETVVAIAAVGGATAATVAIVAVIYAFKGAIFHQAGSSAGKGASKAAKIAHGGGPTHVPVGENLVIHPHSEVGLTFSQVTVAGAATAAPISSYPSLPQGLKFLGTIFDIKTTAVFTGLVLVGLAFDGKDRTEEQKKKLGVYRNDLKKDSVWEDITSFVDTKNNIAYGSTDHFSLFGVH
jgi:hypothetical protein